jgi:hypothetical protein
VHMGGHIHTVSDIQTLGSDIQSSNSDEGVGVSKNPDTVLDFDKE